MKMSALTRKAIADVTRRRGRTMLVVLGIMIGVFGLTMINVANDFVGTAFVYSNSETAAPNIVISVQSVDPALAAELASVANVKIVQIDTRYQTRWRIAATPGHTNISIVGYQDFQQVKLNQFHLVSGRLPGPGEIVMEQSNSALQSFALGAMVTIETAHGAQQLRVVGTSRTIGRASSVISGSARGYMSARALSQFTGVRGANDIEVQVYNTRDESRTTSALLAILQAHHVLIFNSASVDTNANQNIVDALLTIMRVLSFIALVLTSFLILNTVTTLIAEQMRIIGSLKAIGGTRRTILRSYLFSIVIYGLLGTALGLGLGILGGYALSSFLAGLLVLDLGSPQVSLGVVLVSIAVGLGIPLLAALIPLWNGTRITVREAMANYGVSGGSGSQGALARRMTWMPQTTWLAFRSVFRKRGRAILTLLALTFSATAFLAIQTTTYSFDRGLDDLVGVYHFDASVSTTPGDYAPLRARIMSVPNVARVERWEGQMLKTHGGQMLLEGVESDTQLYRHPLLAGRWFNGNEQNVMVISDNLANKAHLKVGDSITFSGSTKTATWKIIGEIHNLNGASGGQLGSAVTTIDNLHRFLDFPASMAYSFMVGATDHTDQAVDRLANHLDDTLSRAGLAPSITTIRQVVQRNQAQFQIVDVLLYAVAAIVALVGILGLFNTLTTSILERRRELGILRAIGATRRQVAGISWLEGIVLALLAWTIAVLIGIPGAYAFVGLIGSVLLPVPFAFSPQSLLVMLVFIMAIATLASVGPALGASRMRIAETLRYE